MNAVKRILFAIAAVTLLGAATFWAVGHFHLSDAFAASAIGIVIGMGVALATVSSMPKKKRDRKQKERFWLEAKS